MFFKCDEDLFSVFDSQTEISVLQLLTQWSYRERKSGKGVLKKSCTYLLWLSSGVIGAALGMLVNLQYFEILLNL